MRRLDRMKHPIPMDDLDSILEKSSLEKVKKIRLIASGIHTTTYLLYTRYGHYVLTVLKDPNESLNLPLIYQSNAFLTDQGFPIPKVLSSGKIMGKAALLTTYHEGKVNHPLNSKDYEKIGFLLGNLHLSAQSFDSPISTTPLILNLRYDFEIVSENLPKEFINLKYYLEEIEKNWPTDLPQGLIHGDIWHKSLLFDNDEIIALLDYTNPSIDLLIYDLAGLLKGIYFNSDESKVKKHIDAFLNSYSLCRPLSPKELSSLNLMITTKLFYTILFMLKKAQKYPDETNDFYSIAYLNFMKLEEMQESHMQKMRF